MATKPSAEVVFKQLASTLIERSGKSPAVLLFKSSSSKAKAFVEIDVTEGITTTELTKYTENNDTLLRAIEFCRATSPDKIYISNLGFNETWQKLVMAGEENCIVTQIENTGETDTTIATSVKALDEKNKGCMFVYSSDAPTLHNKHLICTATNKYIKYYDEDNTELTAFEVNALYAGIIAKCSVDRSITNYTMPLIAKIEVPVGIDIEGADLTSKGVLYAENMAGSPRVVAGVNTAEIDGTITEDMQHIEVVQTMDMIRKDIIDTFCENYRGKVKNNYNRQVIFMGAVKSYYAELENEEILDPSFENDCYIDIESQREAWLGSGKTEADSWSDNKVKLMSYKRKLFLESNIKICQSMEDLKMYVILE